MYILPLSYFGKYNLICFDTVDKDISHKNDWLNGILRALLKPCDITIKKYY